MPSIYSNRATFLLMEIESLFISEFRLRTPFEYDDVMPGDRYGFIEFSEFEADPELQAKDIFKVFKADIILTFGFGRENEARHSFAEMSLDLDNWVGALTRVMSSGYDLLYDFKLRGGVSRSIRQPLRDPGTWIVDVQTQAIARIAIDKDAHGVHKELGQ